MAGLPGGVTDLSPLARLSELIVFMNGRQFNPALGEGPAGPPRQPGQAARRSARPSPR
jgi:hypothetical protein